MELMFPYIRNISDVYPHIKDKNEFILVERPGYSIINYVVSTPTTFSNQIEKECRGIAFDTHGDLIRRPFHKFFNIGEKAETQPDIISNQMKQSHLILEKLDGSMIAPFLVSGKIRLGTKMGITDIALQVESWIDDRYLKFIKECIDNNLTPIFEWVSPDNKIVLNYTEPNLILTGIRDNYFGQYTDYNSMVDIANSQGISVVKAYEPASTNFNAFMKEVKALENKEGYVVRFQDGQMVKAKGDWYLLRHKSKDLISKEHKVVQLILNESIDDLIPMITPEDVKYIEDLTSKLEIRIESAMLNLDGYIHRALQEYPDRKSIGLSNLQDKSSIFAFLNGTTVREIVVNRFKKLAEKESMWNKLL